MSLIEELAELKQSIEEAKKSQAEIEGGLKEVKKTIQREFGHASIKEATKALDKMEATILEREKELNEALDTFMEEYGTQIEQFTEGNE